MNSLNVVNKKSEKTNGLRRNRHLRKITGLFRIIEICVFIILISTQLPVSIKISSIYFRDLSIIFANPRFVFLVGNVIIITLIVKSGQLSVQDSTQKSFGMDLYGEFIEESERNKMNRRFEVENRKKQRKTGEITVVFEDKKKVDLSKKSQRRTETEKCKKMIFSGEGAAKSRFPEDKMSNDEFRSKIEAFIARQQSLRKQETEFSVF